MTLSLAKLKTVFLSILFLHLSVLCSPLFSQYVLQSTDVTISSNYITACSISDFNTAAYDYGNIKIPGQINGTAIFGIGGNPFHGGAMQAKGITALTLPGSIAQIGVFAFADNEISSVTISEGTTRIMSGAFSNNKLTNVTLPSTLKELYNLAFDGNTGLIGIPLPVNSTPGFAGWKDSNGKLYAGGDVITDFTLDYMAQFVEKYTLTDADVTITNGTITACSNSIVGATIVIPDTLQGQEVTGIAANVFSALNIAKIVLPTPETLGFTGWLSGTGTSYNGGANVSNLNTSYTAQFITTYTLTDADVTISSGVISACNNVDNANIIVIPDTLQNQEVTGIGANVFFGYSSVSQIILPASENPNFIAWMSGTGTRYESGATATDLSTTYTALFRFTLTNADVTINGGIISACSNVNNGTVIIIPDTLQNQEVIGIVANVFSSFGNISEITLPTPEASNFVSWISGTGIAYAGGATITDFTTSYTILLNNDWYTLTDADANVDQEGWLQSVSYDFAAKNIIIPDTIDGNPVKKILWGNFEDVGLKKVKLPATVEIIDAYAFIHNQIESIELSDSTYIEMGEGCFNDNILQEINGVPTNGFIYARNSDGSNDSTIIMSYGGGETIMDFIPVNASKLGGACFAECELTSVTIPDNILWIDRYVFYENPKLTPTLPTYTNWIDSKGATHNGGTVISDFSLAYIANLQHTLTDADVVVQEGQIIAYTNNTDYTLITVPEILDGQTVTGIRAGVFENKKIYEMYLPAQTSLSGFDGWINFKGNSVAQSNGTYTIKDFGISYITKLPQYTLTSMDVVMNGNTLRSCSFPFIISDIIIPEILNGQIVKKLGYSSFIQKGITSVKLPATLEEIGEESLSKNLFTSITIPANVTTIEQYAFYGGWTDIDSYLSSVTFEEGSRLKEIGISAFNSCDRITQIDLPDSVEMIGDKAFYLSNLKSIIIPASIKTIGDEAFCNQGVSKWQLTSVVFENNSNLKYLGAGAFANNLALATTGFKLPSSAIPNFKYWRCSGLGTVKSQYSEEESTTILTAQYVAQYPDTLKNSNVTVVNNYITKFSMGNILSNYIVIPDTLDGQAVIGIKENYVFGPFSQYNFREITLPQTLEYIPEYAFWRTDLSDIIIPEKVVHIGKHAFSGTNISYITLPNNATVGFAGWFNGNGKYIELTDSGYVATNMGVSYTATYKVLFCDYDGTVLYTDTVKHYGSAVPPADPSRSGYTFTGWDKSYSNITQGIIVTATYSNNTPGIYMVTFKDWNGTVLSTQTVAENNAATAPSDPSRTGYTFIGWDTDFSKVTSDLTVTAQYSQNGVTNYTVTFKDWDDTVLSTQTVAENSAASAPANPSRIGYTFTGWDTDFSKVTSNLMVTAQYTIKSYSVAYRADENGTVSSENQTVNYGSSAAPVTATPNDGYTFVKWQDKDGNKLSTDNPFTLTKVTCDSIVYAVFEKSTGVEVISTISNLSVYPNPTEGLVTISLDNEEGIVQLIVYNITGEIVFNNPVFNGGPVDLSDLNKGIYLVKVNSEGKFSIVKLIKQ
jgi:hypothetical protein